MVTKLYIKALSGIRLVDFMEVLCHKMTNEQAGPYFKYLVRLKFEVEGVVERA